MGKSTAEIEELAKKYGATVEQPAPAPNELEDLAKKYGATVEHPSAPISTTGSWGPKMDIAERFQTDHPILSSPLTALARFGESAVDAGVGMGKGIYHAFADETKPGETRLPGAGGYMAQVGRRLFVDPQAEEARKSHEANTTSEAFGHAVAAGTPLIGPMVAQLTEQALNQGIPEALGSLAMMYLGGKAGEAVINRAATGGRPVFQPPPTEQVISATSTMIESGVPNGVVNKYAEQTIPIWRKAAAELGKTEEMFPTRSTGTEAGRRALREGGEHAIGIADHAVKIADRPFEDVLRQHGKLSIEPVGQPPHMTVKGKLLSDLDTSIAENSNNPALQNALKDLRGRVETAKTYNDLQSLKVLANKKASGIFDRSMGGQINASADAAYSWKVLGDAIRANMYPELTRISGIDLSTAGRIEGIVMDARDGLRKHFADDVLNPYNKRMQQTYWEHVRDGSLAHRAMWKRALLLEPTPAGLFNKRFLNVMGGETPQMPSSVPYNPKGNYNFAPSEMGGTQLDLVPHEATPVRTGPGSDFPMVTDQEALLAAPPNSSLYTPEVHRRAMAEDIFKVQQRANREARSAPPPTIGPGKQQTIGEKSTPQQTGKPGRPGEFFPGRRGIVVNTEPSGKPVLKSDGEHATNKAGEKLYKHDYSKQEQLFSIKQTPIRFNPMQRTTYTMQDLTSMLHEIHDFVQRNPQHPQVSELMRDIEAVRSELNRRQEAHKVPKSRD